MGAAAQSPRRRSASASATTPPRNTKARGDRDKNRPTTRRTSNACRRCKHKKIKCYFELGRGQSTCIPCLRGRTECVFDLAPDGIPRGAAYIAALEARINTLESELTSGGNHQVTQLEPSFLEETRNEDNTYKTGNAAITSDEVEFDKLHGSMMAGSVTEQQDIEMSYSFPSTYKSQLPQCRSPRKPAPITIFNLLQRAPTIPVSIDNSNLPSENVAAMLVETVFLYTQARYCIVDWVAIRKWHKRREKICNATENADEDSQRGAFFLWMVYAIGAQFVRNAEHSPKEYYDRALPYLQVALAQQDIYAVQALLVLIQYHFRTSDDLSIWHLVGAALRICIEHGYHRNNSKSTTEGKDPYAVESQKRFFWCTYCFDRAISSMTRRPLGIQDADIDADLPVDIDVTCTDAVKIQAAQMKEASDDAPRGPDSITTMSSVLHHLQMYRYRSRIITGQNGPNAQEPLHEEVTNLLAELDLWRQTAPCQKSASNFPQQSQDRIDFYYFQTALLLLRPVLASLVPDQHLLFQCANMAANACENAKLISLSRYTYSSPIAVYNCFRCGLSVFQTLAVQPTVLPLSRIMRAISSCSSGLAVFARTLPSATPFLQLFDKLSDIFLRSYDTMANMYPNEPLRGLLHRIASSNPSEVSDMLKMVDEMELSQANVSLEIQQPASDFPVHQYDFLLEAESMSAVGVDLVMPFPMPSDTGAENHVTYDIPGFWSSPP